MDEKGNGHAEEAEVYLLKETHRVDLEPIESGGYILDIGGGGEGIVGKLNGRRVISIDKNRRELEETKNDSLKIVMDATDLKFLPCSFEVVTSFFTMMYIKTDAHARVFDEAYRVLVDGGRFLIWDLRIPERFSAERFFGVMIKVSIPDETISTGYGVKWEGKVQDMEHFRDLAAEKGFQVLNEWSEGEIFFLELQKS
ncbi:MAG: class I SAM-dependent methyltransferase [Candidatus Bathyarchaeota archaeon]|nr:MAG: class I SAM-dependent methyltransferase [Candidatus Bathyarchaeota archaeon]